MPLQKNQTVRAEITGMTAEGSGVARVDGQAVFVPHAAVGDELLVKIVKANKTYAYGMIREILRPSPDRAEQDCPAYPACGGCVFRHVSYEAELRYKHGFVADALRRIGGLSLDPEPVAAGRAGRCRNKAQYPVGFDGGRARIGFYARRSHRIAEIEDCRQVPAEFADLIRAVSRWIHESGADIYDESTGKGLLRHIFIRKGFATGEILLCLVINGNAVPMERALCEAALAAHPLAGIVLNVNTARGNAILGSGERILYGKGTVLDRMLGLEYEISVRSFYQVNPEMTRRLYQKAAELARPQGKIILDLYCGVGSVGLSMAREAARVIGVEIEPKAVENARMNAARNHIGNAEFHCMDAARAAAFLHKKGVRPDVVLLDPPRKGCGGGLIGTVAQEMKPERVVYISCEPSTLARDLKRFAELGYETRQAAPFDLFPRTGHVECVVLMSRVN